MTNCPLSPLDTTTAEKLEHQLLPPGSRWKMTFLLRWENGPCFQVFGVWIHSPLGHWNCCSKATIAETLRLPFSLVYWLGETDFLGAYFICVLPVRGWRLLQHFFKMARKLREPTHFSLYLHVLGSLEIDLRD